LTCLHARVWLGSEAPNATLASARAGHEEPKASKTVAYVGVGSNGAKTEQAQVALWSGQNSDGQCPVVVAGGAACTMHKHTCAS